MRSCPVTAPEGALIVSGRIESAGIVCDQCGYNLAGTTRPAGFVVPLPTLGAFDAYVYTWAYDRDSWTGELRRSLFGDETCEGRFQSLEDATFAVTYRDWVRAGCPDDNLPTDHDDGSDAWCGL